VEDNEFKSFFYTREVLKPANQPTDELSIEVRNRCIKDFAAYVNSHLIQKGLDGGCSRWRKPVQALEVFENELLNFGLSTDLNPQDIIVISDYKFMQTVGPVKLVYTDGKSYTKEAIKNLSYSFSWQSESNVSLRVVAYIYTN
jgi:hypothetical protein